MNMGMMVLGMAVALMASLLLLWMGYPWWKALVAYPIVGSVVFGLIVYVFRIVDTHKKS